jgi:hypothetical protein
VSIVRRMSVDEWLMGERMESVVTGETIRRTVILNGRVLGELIIAADSTVMI